ncbi:MAG: hypothetical protein J7498_01235 [Sphingobium sp.]|nr:hypothetical protein [Sphingobium sp.]
MTDHTESLETAACLWEAVLNFRDDPSTNSDSIERTLAVRATFREIGTAALRLIVIGWTDAVEADWRRVEDDYPLCFDWDFVPEWIASHVDWSSSTGPILRCDADDVCAQYYTADVPMTLQVLLHPARSEADARAALLPILKAIEQAHLEETWDDSLFRGARLRFLPHRDRMALAPRRREPPQ